MEAAHEADLAVLAHAHSLAGIEHALAAGVDGIEHFTGLAEGGMRVPDEVLTRTAAAGVTVDPTLGFDQAAFDALPAPPPGVLEAMRRAGMDPPSFNAARREVVGRMREHGVRVVTGVDDGAIATKPHGSIALSVERPGARGLPDGRGARHGDLARGGGVRARRGHRLAAGRARGRRTRGRRRPEHRPRRRCAHRSS